jgi:excisionase family DNA binding protein
MSDSEGKSRIMTLKEVAGYLKMTEKAIYRLLEKEAIPAARMGRLWIFDKEDIDRWLKERPFQGKTLILAIDDDILIRALLRGMLDKMGYEVIAEETGLGGLKLMEKYDFDLVFLDLWLPDTDGVEIFRYIKVVYPYTPVVIMADDPDSSPVKQVLVFDPLGILKKPFDKEDVMHMMDKFIETGG